jgi:photosystem II stability/assembly factor-like uncharacterized protein
MSLRGTVWAPRGPSPITDGAQHNNGMVTAIAVHPSDSNILYIGTAGGGVWKSGNGGTTWRPLFDRQLSLGIGEPAGVAIDPNDADILYVGTSGRGRVSPQRQVGLYKSIDGGASWVLLGSGYPAGNNGNVTRFANELINAIVVDPADSRTIYLASSTGVWRSTDAGLNWTQGVGSGGDARSLVLDRTSPNNARILYAGISGSGVIRSTDGGRNWTQILSATTPAIATALAATAGTTMNQVVLDLAPPTSPPAPGGIQVIYVAIAGSHPTLTSGFPDPVGLFMSTDQGATWTQRNASGGPGTSYSGYCLTIAVDPASPGDGNADILYYGTSSQARSTDAGSNFSALGGLHADTHAWAFFRLPAPAATLVFCGNDGGISRSSDNGATWTPLNAGGLQTTLFYNLDVNPDGTGSSTVGALQDNRLEMNTGGPGWNTVAGGDGWDIVYDGTTPNQLFATTNSGSAPQTRVLRSTDGGATWPDVTPWPNTGPEAGFYLSSLAADPSGAGIIYAASNQNLWQTRDGGTNWRTILSIPSGFITATVSVAPTNGNNVVVANGGRVFVSTNALAATVGAPNGVTFTEITRNLPGRTVLRAVFDPNDLTVIYAVLGGFAGAGPAGHVFRTTIGASAWTDISPAVDVPYGAIALDGSDSPTAIYVGTDLGVLRSIDRGDTWYVLDDIHFPRVPVTDLVFGRGSGILRAASYGRGVFEFTSPQWPTIAVNPEAGLSFGTKCDDPRYLTLEVFNVGTGDLIISSVQRLMGSTGFQVLPNPGTPLVIRAGEVLTFTVEFSGSTPGTGETATIRIVSNDPNAPVVDLLATGLQGTASLETAIANAGNFGEVCLGAFSDRSLVLNNRGPCTLRIFNITSSLTAFQVAGVISYPLVVAAGDSIELPIRLQPVARGQVAGTLRITSNDPASPAIVRVSGSAPSPRLVASLANTGNFGDTCLGSFKDEMLTLSNSGRCPLTVTSVTSSSGDFIVPELITAPVVIGPGDDLELMLRFQPSHFGASAGTITIASDDPASPLLIAVNGNTPSGHLTLTGTTEFGGVLLGQRALQTLSICNTGNCDLHVTKVAFLPPCPCDAEKRKPCGCPQPCGGKDSEHHEHDGKLKPSSCDQCCLNFRIVTNPFPATVHPGSCLGVLIQYVPTCDSAACCELVIESDDPDSPVRKLFVTGHLRRTLRSALKCWLAQELDDVLKAGNC